MAASGGRQVRAQLSTTSAKSAETVFSAPGPMQTSTPGMYRRRLILLSAHSANFINPNVVLASHKIFLVRLFRAPACCVRGHLLPCTLLRCETMNAIETMAK